MRRALVGTGDCPRCGTVYLDECQPGPVDELRITLDPLEVLRQSWQCTHLGPDGPHRWTTEGPIALWAVRALHLIEVHCA